MILPFRESEKTFTQPTCPICRSDQVATTSKTISEATYWRCHACGEIWNQSRLLTFKYGSR